ncbi:uncharacterized protein LOC132708331 isoform X2 [Cylas formicarius]|uniref:uncharacterized protein LOC132708331 isoform X2 n=1 Tax=Cylas formicarius TaxID=197179 RepID=UPI002958B3D9|nr:uncharacterized protein LOC132708331 isoform X2 [Cylas formicarius]
MWIFRNVSFAYLIAFAFELLWLILEAKHILPAAAVLLAAGYFALSLFGALLLHGIATKNTLCLITWMFSTTILTFPEAGLVIYMSVDYWGTAHIYGITELSCWLLRIIVNVIEIILVQSLYTTWKDEELDDKRLRDLTVPGTVANTTPFTAPFYQNAGYEQSVNNFNELLTRSGSMQQMWSYQFANNFTPIDGYPIYAAQSEFNASVFMTHYGSNDGFEKKAYSLMDLRYIDQPAMKNAQYWGSQTDADQDKEIMPNLGTMSEISYPIHNNNKLTKSKSMDALHDINRGSRVIRNSAGFYAQPVASYGVPIYYGPLDGPDFLIYKKQVDKMNSKNSLSNNSAEDVQKYRDVAL